MNKELLCNKNCFQVVEKFKQIQEERKGRPIRILMTGRAGAGKSTLVNGLVGEVVAKEGADLTAGTTEVVNYEFTKKGTKFVVFDSPGLQDAKLKDMDTLKQIREKLVAHCSEIELVVYCLNMTHIRIDNSDVTAIKHLTQGFTAELWKRAVFVLTFANRVVPPGDYDGTDEEYFVEQLEKFKKQIKELVPKVPIEVVPAGYSRKTERIPEPWKLPDREDWFDDFWLTCVSRMEQDAAICLLLSQADRFVIVRSPSEDNEIHSRPIHVPESFQTKKFLHNISKVGAVAGGVSSAGGLIAACTTAGSVAGPAGWVVGGLVGLGLSMLLHFNTK